VIGIWPLNIAVMVDKLHPSEAFVEVESFDAKFDKVDLHVEKVLGESIIVGENIYHYYVDLNSFECETPCEGFVPRLYDNPNDLHMKGILVDSITLASRLPLQLVAMFLICFFHQKHLASPHIASQQKNH
jgi:hypothetical protein